MVSSVFGMAVWFGAAGYPRAPRPRHRAGGRADRVDGRADRVAAAIAGPRTPIRTPRVAEPPSAPQRADRKADAMTEPDLGPQGHGATPAVPRPERVEIDGLLRAVARGDDAAFARLYDLLSPRVFGLARRVLRDPAQAEEMAQEVLVEVWRSASRFDPERGSGLSWVLTIAHRRTVDRVRSEQASADRMQKVAAQSVHVPYDEVADQVGSRLERQQVRRCLEGLTELQRESITLAYYGGHTYREVSTLLDIALPTVKTRMRDGLIRLRDCLSVEVIR